MSRRVAEAPCSNCFSQRVDSQKTSTGTRQSRFARSWLFLSAGTCPANDPQLRSPVSAIRAHSDDEELPGQAAPGTTSMLVDRLLCELSMPRFDQTTIGMSPHD